LRFYPETTELDLIITPAEKLYAGIGAKTAEIANLIYASDSQQSLAHTYGWSLTTGRTVADVESRQERLKAVTREQVQAVAEKYLDRKRSVTGYLIPLPSHLAKVQVKAGGDSGTLH